MLQARDRWKHVPAYFQDAIWLCALALIISLSSLSTPSPAATTISHPIRGVLAVTITSSPPRLALTSKSSPVRGVRAATRKLSPVRPAVARVQPSPVVAELAGLTSDPTPSDGYVVTLIHQDFPARAWHAAEAVAWCESKFRTTDIGFDSNGTHDRGLFQLNDGGTEQYLMSMIGQNPKNLNLAFNPVLNV